MVVGLHGCSCHPFKNWDECDTAHKQKLAKGTPVKHRCTGNEGVISKVCKGNFYIVSLGPLPNQQHLYHAAGLLNNRKPVLNDQKTLF